jgi:hypothetical protein
LKIKKTSIVISAPSFLPYKIPRNPRIPKVLKFPKILGTPRVSGTLEIFRIGGILNSRISKMPGFPNFRDSYESED